MPLKMIEPPLAVTPFFDFSASRESGREMISTEDKSSRSYKTKSKHRYNGNLYDLTIEKDEN